MVKQKMQSLFGLNFEKKRDTKYVSDFIVSLSEDLEGRGQVRTARAYNTLLNSLTNFKDREIHMKEINTSFVKAYESFLRDRELQPNTISFYVRNLRSVYNKARKAGILSPLHECLFTDVYTGVEKTSKRAVKKNVISKLIAYDFSADRYLQLSKDLFLFSFYVRGMSFIDMAFLKKSDISNNEIRYRRHKTKQLLEIYLPPQANAILEYYKGSMKSSPYVLPVIKRPGGEERKQYESALKSQNNRLKRISKILGLKTTLTSYVSRHSWATIAKDENIPISVISEGLGHNSQLTTMIYLASFDKSVLHKANMKIISVLEK